MKLSNQLIVTFSSWGSRVITGLASIILVRLLTSSLGERGYAIFVLLAGLEGWFMLADLGIPSALQNRISYKRARQEPYTDIALTAVIIQSLAAIVFLLCFYLMSLYLGPVFLRKFELPVEQSQRYFYITGVIFILLSLGRVGYKIWFAQRLGYIANIAPAFASLLGVAAVYIIYLMDLSEPISLQLLARLGSLSFVALLSVVSFFVYAAKAGFRLDWVGTKDLMAQSFHFWILGLIAAFYLNMDYVLISQLSFEPADIILFSICKQFFDLMLALYAAAIHAAWPVWAELTSQKLWPEVMKNFRTNLILGLAATAGFGILMLLLMPTIVWVLSPKLDIEVSRFLVFMVGLAALVRVWVNTHSALLQSASALEHLWFLALLQVFLGLFATWLTVSSLGISSILFGQIVSTLCVNAWILPLKVGRLCRKTEE